MLKFQSTLPAGGATCLKLLMVAAVTISIHAPRGGSDQLRACGYRRTTNFNPRSPRGERRSFQILRRQKRYFNPRSPRGERRHY